MMLTQLRRIQGRKTVSIFEEINQVDCKALEDIVFDALGLTAANPNEVYWAEPALSLSKGASWCRVG
ncbi:hypothetical protein A2V82_02115 [candidate division KSB1 bacterium RBG_16_48_16]|nr:MAG: hypothetical protein A2V82_02115 [candidate division KSB1 bacterium RBG_16_48_16]